MLAFHANWHQTVITGVRPVLAHTLMMLINHRMALTRHWVIFWATTASAAEYFSVATFAVCPVDLVIVVDKIKVFDAKSANNSSMFFGQSDHEAEVGLLFISFPLQHPIDTVL